MKTAVVTGGTRGIGAALVRAFLREGWNVAYSGTSQETIDKSLVSLQGQFPENRYAAFRCDVAVEDDLTGLWDGAVTAFSRVDIWINNAGTSSDQTPFHKLPTEVFTRIIDTVAPFLVRKMIDNIRHGAKISWLTNLKVMKRFLLAPFSRRDIVSKYL